MFKSLRIVEIVVALLALGAAVSAAAQQAVSAPSAQSPAAQADKRVKTELDKKYDEIMKGDGTPDAKANRLRQLEQFIRDNPDFPGLEKAYSDLLMFLRMGGKDAAKAIAVADEALKKYPEPTDASLRPNAFSAKYAALRQQKDDKAVEALLKETLATETDPDVLARAAMDDKASALEMLEKALAVRDKHPSKDQVPWLDELRWSYADALNDAGRTDEAVKVWVAVLDANNQKVAEIEALPKNDPKRSQLGFARMVIGRRYQALVAFYLAKNDYDRAFDYLRVSEEAAGPTNPLCPPGATKGTTPSRSCCPATRTSR